MQVFSLKDGQGRNMWRNLRVPITIIQTCHKPDHTVDWLKYVNSSFYDQVDFTILWNQMPINRSRLIFASIVTVCVSSSRFIILLKILYYLLQLRWYNCELSWSQRCLFLVRYLFDFLRSRFGIVIVTWILHEPLNYVWCFLLPWISLFKQHKWFYLLQFFAGTFQVYTSYMDHSWQCSWLPFNTIYC